MSDIDEEIERRLHRARSRAQAGQAIAAAVNAREAELCGALRVTRNLDGTIAEVRLVRRVVGPTQDYDGSGEMIILGDP